MEIPVTVGFRSRIKLTAGPSYIFLGGVRMRTAWKGLLLAALLLVPLLAWPLLTAPAAGAAEPCDSGVRQPVTLLVRPGETYPFIGVDPEGHSPYIDPAASRTVAPLRPLFTALSPHTESVMWNEGTRTASFSFGASQMSIQFPNGSTRAYSANINGRNLALNSHLCNGRVYAPVRTIAEAMDIGITYYPEGIVVIDPARKLPTVEATPGAAPAGIHVTQADSCGPWPGHIIDFLSRPSEASRQAANAAACRIIRSQ